MSADVDGDEEDEEDDVVPPFVSPLGLYKWFGNCGENLKCRFQTELGFSSCYLLKSDCFIK